LTVVSLLCRSARDVVRPEAAEAVAALRRRGVRACMLTGDAPAAAAAVAAAVGIPAADTHAGLLPQEKLDKVGWPLGFLYEVKLVCSSS
jgi:P-type E1-E2 ATPase